MPLTLALILLYCLLCGDDAADKQGERTMKTVIVSINKQGKVFLNHYSSVDEQAEALKSLDTVFVIHSVGSLFIVESNLDDIGPVNMNLDQVESMLGDELFTLTGF